MKRAAIYARYSSDLQTDRSIEDQVSLCSDFAAKQGLAIVAEFDDRARSGASIMGRDGVLAMMDAARDGKFDVLVVEALDRLSRDQEDLAGIYKRLTHIGVEIRAVHDGKADIVQVGIRGLVGALYLQDLAHKVRRGMAGVVRDGRNAGGKAYGYAPVPGKPGELVIVEEEAEVVRRIFADYAAGKSPREIAGDLNAENVAPPRGAFWQASTINGNRKRANGMLQNPIYDGRIVWNRVRMVKDPDTGKRISRVNPQSEWQEEDAPHLRIVLADIFAQVNGRKVRATSDKPMKKNARILSGLLKCGACGAGMSIKDKMGRVTRIMCTKAKEARSCHNTRPYVLDDIEATVVDGLRSRLDDPKLLEFYVECYNDEHKKLYAGQGVSREKARQRLAAAEREYQRILQLAIKGVISEEEAAEQLPPLREEKKRLTDELAVIPEPPKVVTLKPALVARYLRSLEELDAAVKSGGMLSLDVRRCVRDLVTSVTVFPSSAGERPVLKVDGYLSSLVDEGLSHRFAVRGGTMVAEEGFEPPTQGL
ncbi:recombinase family protein [Mesorhizobium soli]|uniref:Recombinase family protein n=2 Tax=Pseudaminobacter soli (ex Li et al. 2025) TaxID=1295366 RepID=A0A2P7S036_9HYPH|nr:recombinase family protein [Mesorhizobium soli]